MYEDIFSFVNSTLSEGSFFLRINNLYHFYNQVVRVKACFIE